MKTKDKFQMNIKIDAKLILRLKSQAIENEKYIIACITDLLEQGSKNKTRDIVSL